MATTENKKFPSKLKYADLTPILKKLECVVLKENYRLAVSICLEG